MALFFRVLLLLSLVRPAFGGPAHDLMPPDERHRAALALARDHPSEGLAALAQLVQEFPGTHRFRYDFIAVAVQARLYSRALDAEGWLDSTTTPAFVEEALAEAETQVGLRKKATQRLQALLSRFPDRCATRIQLGWLIEQPATPAVLERFAADSKALCPSQPAVIEQYAYALKQNGKWSESLREWHALEAIAPHSREALNGRVLSLRQLRSAPRALELRADPLSDADLIHETGVQYLRWADASEGPPYAAEDLALSRMRLADSLADPSSATVLPRRFDYIVALVQRRRMQAAIDAYTALDPASISTPAYAHRALGEAYLATRQPLLALYHFNETLRAAPHDESAKQGRVSALSSLGLHTLAITEAAEAVQRASLPNSPRRFLVKADVEDRRTGALILEGELHVFAEDYEGGLKLIDQVLAEAPETTAALNSKATALRWLGRWNEAEALNAIAKHQNPAATGALLGSAALYRDEGNLVLARQLTRTAVKNLDPDDLNYVNPMREQALAEMGELSLHMDTDGTATAQLESPAQGNVRLGYRKAEGLNPQQEVFAKSAQGHTRWRAGWATSPYREGPRIESSTLVVDGLRMDLGLSMMPDLPRKALAARITGTQAVARFQWTPTLRESFSIGAVLLDTSDDNRRSELDLRWQHIALQTASLQGFWGLTSSLSKGKDIPVAYYNPSLAVVQGFIGIRWLGEGPPGSRSPLWHTVVVDAGAQWEAHTENGMTPRFGVDYTFEKKVTETERFGGGLRLGRRAYDGVLTWNPMGSLWYSRNF